MKKKDEYVMSKEFEKKLTEATEAYQRGPDVRLLVIEQEFASVFKVLRREGNTLSTILRCAWDDARLAVLTRREPLEVEVSHVSILANITQDELRSRMEGEHASNGFANRFLFLQVQRAKLLANPPVPPESQTKTLAQELRNAIAFAQKAGEMRRDSKADELWESTYPLLESLGEGEGKLVPALLARASAQVLRLSMIYALLDQSAIIRVEHLRAALALYQSVESSVRAIFGEADVGDLVDRARKQLQHGPRTRTELSKGLGGHFSSDEIGAALGFLRSNGEADFKTTPTDGRARESWFLVSEPNQ